VSWPIQVTRAGGPRGPTCPVPPPSVLTRRLWCTFSRRDRPCLLAPQRGRGCRDDGYRVEGRLALPTHASRRRGGSLPMIDRIGEGAWLVPIGQSGLWCSTSQVVLNITGDVEGVQSRRRQTLRLAVQADPRPHESHPRPQQRCQKQNPDGWVSSSLALRVKSPHVIYYGCVPSAYPFLVRP